ncbi:FlgD immunoglobulin-like domain containing protein [Candidatus Latescibacterota bacterium]
MKLLYRGLIFLLFLSVLCVSSAAFAVEYVGPDTCAMCHSSIHDDYSQSGHPYKLNKVVDGVKPVYPNSEVPNTPEGYTWDDITYVIGGYGWKARFLDKNGYIITGDAVQYNLATKEWSGYHADEDPGTKPYNCGTCHTTGWQTTEENGGKKQDDLEGMAGTFADPGITCEGCHGPGSAHAESKDKADISRDTSKEMCGTCHYRDSEHRIAVSGGLIRHHEQYDELINSPHRNHECITCHEPHKSTKYAMGGLKEDVTCTMCHGSAEVKVQSMAGHSCETCHMPLSAKSAVYTGDIDFGPDADTGHLGDIHAHTYRLNTDPDINMFTEDGKYIALDDDGHAIVKVEFACAACHDGSTAPAQTVDWMYANAMIVHSGGPTAIAADLAIPQTMNLLQNFPNPFNPTTNIRYDLETSGQVQINIYDIRGALVRSLVDQSKSAGRYLATWDGLNNNGQGVSSGVYICRLNVSNQVASTRMTLVR